MFWSLFLFHLSFAVVFFASERITQNPHTIRSQTKAQHTARCFHFSFRFVPFEKRGRCSSINCFRRTKTLQHSNGSPFVPSRSGCGYPDHQAGEYPGAVAAGLLLRHKTSKKSYIIILRAALFFWPGFHLQMISSVGCVSGMCRVRVRVAAQEPAAAQGREDPQGSLWGAAHGDDAAGRWHRSGTDELRQGGVPVCRSAGGFRNGGH